MIHQVKRLSRAERLLPAILDIQIAVLRAVAQSGFESHDICASDHFCEDLASFLNHDPRFRGRGTQIAKWVTRKKTNLLEPLNRFSKGPLTEKRDFIEGIEADIALLWEPQNSTFSIAILKDAPEWKRGAKDYLKYYYKFWRRTGFDSPFFTSELQSPKYTRLDFIDEFVEKNSNLYVCAICDGSAFKTKTESKTYTSIEHFFPKSIYPHLSCHPRNLIPICSFCNSYIKTDKDPLDLSEDNRLTLANLPLPYQDFSFQKQTYIAVVAQDAENGEKPSHPKRLELRPARDVNPGEKIDAINHLYDIDTRWSEELNQIEEQAFRRIFQFLTLTGPSSLEANPEELSNLLRTLMAITDMENMGKDPFAFPTVWLIKSYIDRLEREGEESAVYRSITHWLKDIHKRWLRYYEHSRELEERVPNE